LSFELCKAEKSKLDLGDYEAATDDQRYHQDRVIFKDYGDMLFSNGVLSLMTSLMMNVTVTVVGQRKIISRIIIIITIIIVIIITITITFVACFVLLLVCSFRSL
jgi:hypothetical protein